MKATTTEDLEMINPLWFSATDKTGIQERLPIPAGTVMDNPDAWMLVMLHKAVPADDECKARVNAALTNPQRLAMLENVRRLRAADGVQQLDKKSKKWLDYMEKTYAAELDAVPAAE